MSEALHIDLDIPIRSVGVVADDEAGPEVRAALRKREAELKRLTEQLGRLCAALETAHRRLDAFYADTICSQAQCVANLSVRIAEKILFREISSGNYDIDKIVAEALKAAPTRQNLVIHLNPEDLEQYTRMVQDGRIKTPAGVKLTADETIERAECVVETGQGTIEYFIDEHLRQIGEALEALQ
jgi:flagellar biosynthesis/type III secretory pathway protein FliH